MNKRLFIKKNILWKIYIILLFVTDTLSFKMFGGNMRYYYLLSAIIVFMFIKCWNDIFNTKTYRTTILFLISLGVAAMLSHNISGATAAMISLTLNILSGASIYFILRSRRIEYDEFYNFLEKMFIFLVYSGLFMYIVYATMGINLGINNTGILQLTNSQIAGFRQEANAHGKLICYILSYCIPFLILGKVNKQIRILLVGCIATLIVSPTRSATYALLIAISFALVYYLRSRYAAKIFKSLIVVIAGVFLFLYLTMNGIINLGEYSTIKLNNFFLTNIYDISKDGSGAFRIESLMAALDIWLQNKKTIMFGVGYNQTNVVLQNGTVNTVASGVEAIGLLAGGGLISFCTWLAMIIASLRSILTSISILRKKNIESQFPHVISLFVAVLYLFFIEFISGAFYVPETWITFGLIAFHEKELLEFEYNDKDFGNE